ncbi:MAG: ACP S-malonyltransferase [Syntrophobacterales bacterium]|nr:ACP S-malonyltransferase [Syntrophobacterales bacterium]
MEGWVFLFPGQGSQYVGMGRSFYESYGEIEKLVEEASHLTGVDIAKLCFEGPEEELTLTKNVQLAITVVNISCLKVLELHGVNPVASAGHSLGEYSALYAAGVMDLPTLLRLVYHRGRLMHEAAERVRGSMLALMYATDDQIKHICDVCEVEVANINSPEQVIVTGTIEGIQRAVEESRKIGIRRTVLLNVSGAWHSKWMRNASEEFGTILEDCSFSRPLIPVVMNINARVLTEEDNLKEKLKNQIVSPVLWKQSIEYLIDLGYDKFVEVGPKRVLSGLVRKINKNVQTAHVEDPSSLASFLKAYNDAREV